MTALAVLLGVALVLAALLVAWRWWLVHSMALAKLRKAEVDLSLAVLPAQMRELESRMTDLEVQGRPRR